MKRAFLLFPVAALALALSTTIAISFPLPRVGVLAGGQLTRFSDMDQSLWPATQPQWSRTGFGGVTAAWPLRGRLALAAGLEYGDFAEHGAALIRYSVNGEPYFAGETANWTRQRTLSLPVRIEWSPGRWHVGAGPELRYLLRADFRAELSPSISIRQAYLAGRAFTPDAAIFEDASHWHDVTDTYRRWSLAAQFAVGRDLAVGRHLLHAEVRWSQGLTDQRHVAPAYQQFTMAGQLALGWVW